MPSIKLQSEEGIPFTVDVEVAKGSFTLKTLLEATPPDEIEGKVIPLIAIRSTIMIKIIQWLVHYKDLLALPLEQQPFGAELTGWDVDFFRTTDEAAWYQIMQAAVDLNIPTLMHACGRAFSIAVQLQHALNIPSRNMRRPC